MLDAVFASGSHCRLERSLPFNPARKFWGSTFHPSTLGTSKSCAMQSADFFGLSTVYPIKSCFCITYSLSASYGSGTPSRSRFDFQRSFRKPILRENPVPEPHNCRRHCASANADRPGSRADVKAHRAALERRLSRWARNQDQPKNDSKKRSQRQASAVHLHSCRGPRKPDASTPSSMRPSSFRL